MFVALQRGIAGAAGIEDAMQSVGRDPFGLDMIPEVDMSEVEDQENGLAGNLPVPRPNCLDRIAQLDSPVAVPDPLHR